MCRTTTTCRSCGTTVHAEAAGCPSCGDDPTVRDERLRLAATSNPRRTFSLRRLLSTGSRRRRLLVAPVAALLLAELVAPPIMLIGYMLLDAETALSARVAGGFLVVVFSVVFLTHAAGLIDGSLALLRGHDDARRWLRVSWLVLSGSLLVGLTLGVLAVDEGHDWPVLPLLVADYLIACGWLSVLARRRRRRGPSGLRLSPIRTLIALAMAAGVALVWGPQGLEGARQFVEEGGATLSVVLIAAHVLLLPPLIAATFALWLAHVVPTVKRQVHAT